jgi:holo-[acyl-carrier protein] synthase
MSWQDAEVVIAPGGRPTFSLTGTLAQRAEGLEVHLSLSHDGAMALAFVVLERA